ncbi:hypothetical protein NXV35_22705 [Bacteroides faecis]|nr:hypothetical protein [Bacteroides faecis]
MLNVNGAQAATFTAGSMVTQVGNTSGGGGGQPGGGGGRPGGMVNSSLPLKRVLWSILFVE